MKILYITSGLDVKDGWGRYSNGLVMEMAKNNEVFVLSHIFHEAGGIDQKSGLHSPLSLANPLKILRSSRKIQHHISSFKPDIVHFLAEPYVLTLPLLRIPKKTKTILTVHGTYSFMPLMYLEEKLKAWIVTTLTRKAYDKIDRIISVSSFTKLYLLDKYNDFYRKDFSPDKIAVISNGIDLSQFSSEKNKKHASKRSILFVGAIKRRKGILESINALAQYRDSHGDDFTYTIVGSQDENDSYIKMIKDRIVELKMEDKVVFSGFVDKARLEELYEEADLFLMLSIQSGLSVEGFGLVYLEANAHGVPVIGSKDSGAIDAISEGKSGYLVDPNDSIDAAGKIHSILDKRSSAQKTAYLGRKNRISEKKRSEFSRSTEVIEHYLWISQEFKKIAGS